jgi:hypothetical protein
MSLLELQVEWIQMYDELGESFGGQALAAPFFSVPGGASVEDQKRPILLVGKATAGSWGETECAKAREKSIRECVDQRLNCTLGGLEWRRKEHPRSSAFWRYRNGLEQIGKSVIWTNLAKIGVQEGNPNWSLVLKQSELAYRTLAGEIEEYKPALIVLVTGDFGRHEIVWPLFGGADAWRDDPTKSYRWQERSTFSVPILWTKHPERKPDSEVQLWLRKARELYELSTRLPATA